MTAGDRQASGAQPLSGLRVIDLSNRLSGAFAARLFADFGADVVLAEPPSGHALRHEPPFIGPGDALSDATETGDGAVSSLHAYANWNKRAQVVRSRSEVEELVSDADVVVTTGHSPELPERVVELSITAHGLRGPLADVPGENLTTCARTGWALMNAYDGEPPLQLPVWQTGYLAGIVGFTAAAAAMRVRDKRSGYEQIEISEFDVMELTSGPWAVAAVFRGVDTPHGPGGARTRDRPGPLFQTADGRICFSLGDFKNWTAAMAALGLDEYATDPLLIPDFGRHRQKLTPVAARAAERLTSMHRWPLFHRLGALRCVSGCLHSLTSLLDDEQLRHRGFFVDAAVDDRRAAAPGFPARTSAELWRLRHPAPPLPAATDTGDTDAGGRGRGRRDNNSGAGSDRDNASGGGGGGGPIGERQTTAATSSASAALPLAGVRVLSFTQAWSGTLGTQLLALLGADVVQIELLHKSDVWRNTGGVPDGIADPDRRQIAQNTQGLYNSVNLNKRAIALDLGTDAGRDLFWRLAPRFDIVAENFAPHVMPNWGIDLDTLSQARPDVVFASISGYGSTGPYSRYPANGSTIEPMSGLSSIHGYRPDPGNSEHQDGMNTGGLLPDPVAAFWFAASVVAALSERDRTGQPQRIDISMMEAVTATIGHAVLEAALTGDDRSATGNRHPRLAPHGYFPTANGEWLALATTHEAAWRVVAERAGLADDQRFANLADRKANEDALELIIADWTGNRDAAALAAELGALGVTAARVTRGTEVFLQPDPHLLARGFLTEVEHPESGRNLLAGRPWTYSNRPADPLTPSPGVGQHSREVLRTELGLADADYDRLVADGVTGTL